MDIKETIKSAAFRAGFDEVGFTRTDCLKPADEKIKRWIEEGYHGSMTYLEDYYLRRERFLKEFGEVKSILVLGVNYYSVERSEEQNGTDQSIFAGKIARYAWGRDYHRVIAEKHTALISELQKKLGRNFKARSCVDTQPLPERFAAVQSGMGFVGKHTNLLHSKFGPWLFLSEIVTDLVLEPDSAASGTCGTCTHCQKVCPTDALGEDYRMDARKCIAYLTIEHKGIIPRGIRPEVKDWLFGCDECLNICPFTSKSRQTLWPEFQPDAGEGERLDIRELFELRSNSQYKARFQGTALLRASRKQMLRNACLVLGNSGDTAVLPYLKLALQDPSSLVRLHAAWAISRFPGKESISMLTARQDIEDSPEVLDEIGLALNQLQV